MQTSAANFQASPMAGDSAGLKKGVATVSAILLGIIFLVSGGWKVLMPFQTGELLEQARVPAGWGVAGASALGTLELLAAFLLFAPRYRRLGGLLGAGLMVFFLGWIAYFYNALVGHECSCFPIIKRTVGPGFFISDGVMLLFALAALAWGPKIISLRGPAVALASLVIFAGLSFATNKVVRNNSQVPNPVIVEGKPADLRDGKVFLFFYDPECSHCDAASKYMSTLTWTNTKIVAIPTHDSQFAADFLHDTHLKAATSLEIDKLRKAFPFVDPPYGVVLVDGQVKETMNQAQFNAPSPAPDLKKWGFVQ